MKAVLLVAAGGPVTGLGHVRRCLALARDFRARGTACRFLVTHASCLEAPRGEGFEADILKPGQDLQADLLVADGHDFDPGTLAAWRETSGLLTVIDDFAARKLPADLVVNHNPYAEKLDYTSLTEARVLKGPRYAIIDPRFQPGPPGRRSGRRLLLSFGGSDDGRRALAVALAVQERAGSLPIDLVLSPLHRAGGHFGALARRRGGHGLRIWRGAPMHELMARAGVFAGAVGVTALECAAADLPLVGVELNETQRSNGAALRERGLRVFRMFDADAMAKAALAERARRRGNPMHREVDGKGSARVAGEILALLETGPPPEG